MIDDNFLFLTDFKKGGGYMFGWYFLYMYIDYSEISGPICVILYCLKIYTSEVVPYKYEDDLMIRPGDKRRKSLTDSIKSTVMQDICYWELLLRKRRR